MAPVDSPSHQRAYQTTQFVSYNCATVTCTCYTNKAKDDLEKDPERGGEKRTLAYGHRDARLVRSVLQLLAHFHPFLVPARLSEKHFHFSLHLVHHACLLVMARVRVATGPSFPLRGGAFSLALRHRRRCTFFRLWARRFFSRAIVLVLACWAALFLFCRHLLLELRTVLDKPLKSSTPVILQLEPLTLASASWSSRSGTFRADAGSWGSTFWTCVPRIAIPATARLAASCDLAEAADPERSSDVGGAPFRSSGSLATEVSLLVPGRGPTPSWCSYG